MLIEIHTSQQVEHDAGDAVGEIVIRVPACSRVTLSTATQPTLSVTVTTYVPAQRSVAL